MEFEKPRDYVETLKKLEGFSSTGAEVGDGRLFFTGLSRRVSLPLRKAEDWGYKAVRYSLNKLDVLAHATLEDVTRTNRPIGELHGRSLHDSLTVGPYKKYARPADGAVFAEEADGRLRPSVVDRGDAVSIMTDGGGAVGLFFGEEDDDDR